MKLRASLSKISYPHPLLFVLAALMLTGAFAPAPARAAERVASMQDSEGNVAYFSSVDEVASSLSDTTDEPVNYILFSDWKLTKPLTIEEGQNVRIDMNGHQIYYNKNPQSHEGIKQVIKLEKNSTLTLASDRTSSFIFVGYALDGDSGCRKTGVKLSSGGLVTADEASACPGIVVDGGATLNLDNVAVAGFDQGGIVANEGGTINMTNGAIVSANKSPGWAGGVQLHDDSTLNMDNSEISGNYSPTKGGGVFAFTNVTITMTNGAKIDGNHAEAGGGVYFAYSNFKLESKDKTGVISNNVAYNEEAGKESSSGGGVHVDQVTGGTDVGLIRGISITDNVSYYDGGGVELDQQSTTLEDCTITGNAARYEGGGVYVCNKNNTIKNCTIQNNCCNTSGKNYEGGGVYVSYEYDIELLGTVNITGNTRGKDTGDADDLFLRDNVGSTIRAYITGSVTNRSKIGVRTGITGDRRIGKDIPNHGGDAFFIDLDNYHVSYGTDEGGDIWQRKGAVEYEVTLDGRSLGTYKAGEQVTVNGEPADSGRAFQSWSSTYTVGLEPFSEYVKDPTNPSLTFTMPKRSVKLSTNDFVRATKVTITVDKPVPGQALSTSATLGWGTGKTATVSVVWQNEEGQLVSTAAYGEKYSLRAVVDEDRQAGLAFSRTLASKDVTYCFSDGSEGVAAQEARVDELGRLYATSAWIEMPKLEIASVEDANITVTAGLTRDALVAMLPDAAWVTLQDDSKISLETDKTLAGISGLDTLIGEDGTVVEPTDESVYDVMVPLASSDKVSSVEGKSVKVRVLVLPGTDLAAPVLSLPAGTYEGNTLKLTATCATSGATIMYRIGDDTHEYDPTAGIVLTGEANKKTWVGVWVWAQTPRGQAWADQAWYQLDDTVNKPITVNCSDTAYYGQGDTRWSSSFEAKGTLGAAVTITAPAQDGRVFDHWEWTDAPEGVDLEQDALVIPKFTLDYTGQITAVYTPVITAVDLQVDAPTACALLSQAATALKVRVGSESSWCDATEYFSEARGAIGITWSPSGDDEGRAAHLAPYTASLKLAAGKAADEGVNYAFAESLDLYVNGAAASNDSAWVSKQDSAKYLHVVFPETGAYVYESMYGLDGVNISFEGALAAKSADDDGGEGDWGLPREVGVTFACGETDLVDVEWERVTGFDPANLGAQTLTARGKVSYPSYIDATGAPTEVEMTVNVAAHGQVVAPTASIASGTYAGAQSVGLSCSTQGATIRYTTDGTEPTAKSPIYKGDSIRVTSAMTIKAKAFLDGWAASETSTFVYIITYKVTFDAAGGSSVDEQVVEAGQTATEPAAPTRAGYDFAGWTLDGKAYDFANPVTGDLALIATWDKQDGGSDTDPDDPDVDPDVDPDGDPDDGKGDKGDERPDDQDGKGGEQSDSEKGGSSKREALPGTGDVAAVAGVVAAAGAALAARGMRARRRR